MGKQEEFATMRLRAAALMSALLLFALPAEAGSDLAGMETCMVQAARTLGFNGIANVGRGADIVEKTVGTADKDGRRPISPETKFNIGSAGKMFTAVAIAQLAEKGALSFDDPVGKFLTGLKSEVAKVTIAQLLTHSSGLGDYLKPPNREIIESARTATALLPIAVADGVGFSPGSKFAYSNSGYVVLGAVIEKVSGESYADYLQKEIFARAGMTRTTLGDNGSADPMTRMSPQGMLDKPVLSPLRLPFASPAGGHFSTAADMGRFLDALQGNVLVSAATKQKLFTPYQTRNDGTRYGFGFVIAEGPPLRVGHGGGAPGINAEIALFPASGWHVVALSNSDPPTATRLANVLEKALFAPDRQGACKAALAVPTEVQAPMILRHP